MKPPPRGGFIPLKMLLKGDGANCVRVKMSGSGSILRLRLRLVRRCLRLGGGGTNTSNPWITGLLRIMGREPGQVFKSAGRLWCGSLGWER